MIYITGDCHADFRRFQNEIFPEQEQMTKDDYVIVCGDFGGVWMRHEESEEEKWWLDWLEQNPFSTLFVDGNHENFDRLYKYPEEKWNGGKAHRIRPTVIHLMRGQVFLIGGKKIFTFGGASSHDIYNGVLDMDDPEFWEKKRRLDSGYRFYRINHLSWWKEELPSEEELKEGRDSLKEHNYEVDFIVTHCCATSTEKILSDGKYKSDFLNDYLEEIKQNTKFTKWFFGHYHENKNVTDKEIVIYEQIIRIA